MGGVLKHMMSDSDFDTLRRLILIGEFKKGKTFLLKIFEQEQEECAKIADATIVADSGSATAQEIARKIRSRNSK